MRVLRLGDCLFVCFLCVCSCACVCGRRNGPTDSRIYEAEEKKIWLFIAIDVVVAVAFTVKKSGLIDLSLQIVSFFL